MGKRIIPQRRGHGSQTYRSPSHRHLADPGYPHSLETTGKVKELHHSPGHTAPLAEIEFDNGETTFLLAHHNMWEGETIVVGNKADVKSGNVLPLKGIPVGSFIHNLEIEILDGGKLVKSAGTYATIISHGKDSNTVKLPSGKFKTINNNCRATIGVVAGGGHKDKPFAKAGKKYHTYRSKAKRHKKVRGVAMNAVNHPHGGGDHQHVGRPSTVSIHASPGRKVGRLSPQKKKKLKDKKR